MINEILTAAGVLYHETQFSRMPAKTHAVYFDEVEPDGGDYVNLVYRHDITVELYAPKPDPEAEAAIERELNARGLKWHKQPRYWVQDALRYQTIYEFSYIEKL